MSNQVKFRKNELRIYDKKFVKFISYSEIINRIKLISDEIKRDYKGKEPVIVVILKGAIFFATELLKNLDFPLRVETLKAKSYGNRMKSSGNVELFITCEDLEGRDIILVEDIIDTGLTISTVVKELLNYKPNSIKIATLLLKTEKFKVDLKIDYCGFEIPDRFVIGFGLDFAELGRNLKHIYILE
ncbi:MAG: hypoxanthine phosphoribosyltransferase [Candidatus Kapaibacteriota bacterium]